MDFSDEILENEAYFIYRVMDGFYSYNDIKKMDWLAYEKALIKAKELNKKNG
jgi:hypothetical protein